MAGTLPTSHPSTNRSSQTIFDDRLAARALRLAKARLRDFPRGDREDFLQDVMVAVAEKIRGYDPARGTLDALVSVVIDSKIENISRGLSRRLKRPRAEQLHDRMAQEDPELDATERRLDLDAALATLQDRDRRLCKKLLLQRVSQIAREESRPRTTIHRQMQRIRASFEAAGLFIS